MVSLLGFFLFPFILSKLGNEVNGIWQLIGSITAYFGLLELGITASITKMIAERASHDEPANDLIRNAFYLFAVIGAAILVLGLALLPFIGGIFNVPSSILHETDVAYLIVLVSMAITFPAAVFAATFAGHQEYQVFNIFVITQALLGAAGIVLALGLGYGIIGLAIQSFVVTIFMFCLQLFIVRRRYGVRVGGKIRPDRLLIRKIIKFSKWIFLMNIAVQIVFYTDNVVLGIFASLSAITFYQVALKPNNFLRNLSGQLLTVVMPASAGLRTQKDTDRIGRLLVEATRITSIVLMPFVIVLVAWGQDFIRIWVGPEYLSSYPTLVVLTIGIFATSLGGASSQILVALDRPSFLAKLALFEAGLNLVASIVLVKAYGIIGVAIGTTVPTFIASMIIVMPIAARMSSVKPSLIYKKLTGPVLIGAIFLLGSVWFDHVRQITTWFGLIVAAIIVFAAYVTIAILIDPKERHIYVDLMKRVTQR